VVSGIGESMPREAREQRMNLYVQFMKEIELVQPGADDRVSEVDLSDAADLRVTLTGLGVGSGAARRFWCTSAIPILATGITCSPNISMSGAASAGSVDSVDLRFARQVVVNPETSGRREASAPRERAPRSVPASAPAIKSRAKERQLKNLRIACPGAPTARAAIRKRSGGLTKKEKYLGRAGCRQHEDVRHHQRVERNGREICGHGRGGIEGAAQGPNR
jgi:hypothetical protein